MQEEFLYLDIDDVDFDKENPRIKIALERYKDEITAERIYFALQTATPESSSGNSGFMQLKESIKAHGGLAQPITVVERNGIKTCIDGNTRLAIFKDFQKNGGTSKDWSKIPASLIRNAEQIDIEKIRTSAHLVGARQWPAYEKARYLDYLYNQEFMNFDKMVALCGGNKTEIQRQIDAFEDMNEFYRDVVEDNEFKIDRFSGFVELQKPSVKESIFEAGYGLEDFGKWINSGQIRKLADVRNLPRVLRDEEAKQIFTEGDIDSISTAIRHVEDKARNNSPNNDNVLLENASIELIAQTLKRKMDDMPRSHYRVWQQAETEEVREAMQTLEDLHETLEEILSDVRKQ